MCIWFKHDCTAKRSKKLKKLRSLHGREGVCIYWDLLEELAEDSDHFLPNNFAYLSRLLGCISKRERDALKYILEESELIAINQKTNEIYSKRLSEGLGNIKPKAQETEANVETLTENATEQQPPKDKRGYNLSDKGKESLQQGAAKSREKKAKSQGESQESQSEQSQQSQETPKVNVNNLKDKSQGESQEDLGEYKGEKEIENKNRDLENNSFSSSELVALWNATCKSLPKVRADRLGDKRQLKIRNRRKLLGSTPEEQRATWITICQKLEASDFANGSTGKWRASFDWVIDNETNMLKILEGNYDTIKGSATPTPQSPERNFASTVNHDKYRKMGLIK